MPSQRCFVGNGTDYRGVASTAASGLGCLAWNSDLLYQELHVDSVDAAALLGLGPHTFCRSAAVGSPGARLPCPCKGHPEAALTSPPCPSRNPDKDERPWCYVVKDQALSWEYCRLAACGEGPGPSQAGMGRTRLGTPQGPQGPLQLSAHLST